MAGPGLTFAPMEGDAADRQATAAQLSPQQRAVQVLSMRLPRVLGARRIAPRELAGVAGALPPSASVSPPGGFSPESALLQTLLHSAGVGTTPITPSGGGGPIDDVVTAPKAPPRSPTFGAGGGGEDAGPSTVPPPVDRMGPRPALLGDDGVKYSEGLPRVMRDREPRQIWHGAPNPAPSAPPQGGALPSPVEPPMRARQDVAQIISGLLSDMGLRGGTF